MGKCSCCSPAKPVIITYGKYSYENGNYYLGNLLNNTPHGKGILYLKNNEIKYDGDFVNGKKEGNGKYFYEDKEMFVMENNKKFYFMKGDFYTGQWRNDYMNGQGIIYLNNGKIKYKGDFVDDKFEGYGQYNFESGGYYIGQFLNDLQHGNGKLYDKNGNIMIEGNFINDHLDGNGKIYNPNGEYFIGQFKEGKIHGKGKSYTKNGDIFLKVNILIIKKKELENIILKTVFMELYLLQIIKCMVEVKYI